MVKRKGISINVKTGEITEVEETDNRTTRPIEETSSQKIAKLITDVEALKSK